MAVDNGLIVERFNAKQGMNISGLLHKKLRFENQFFHAWADVKQKGYIMCL